MAVVISGDTGISPVTASGTSASVDGMTVGRGGGEVATNTAVGVSALATNSTGTTSVAIGYQALTANTTGTYNTALGYQAGYTNTVGTGHASFGYQAGYSTTGNGNTLLGNSAGYYVTSGANNTYVGNNAGPNIAVSTGSFNTGIGGGALNQNTTGIENTAVGYQSINANTTSSYNTAVGRNSLYLTTGGYNTCIGHNSGYNISTGTKNSILGRYDGNQGGLDIRTASNYVVLSDGDGNPVGYYKGNNQAWVFGQGGTGSTGDGNMYLNGAAPAAGNGAYLGGQSNGTTVWAIGSYRAVISGTATWFTCQNSGGGGVYLNGASATSWTAVSDETRKVIIEPITDAANKVSTLRAVIGRLKTDDESVRRPYLIAQDVQAVLPEAVSENEDKEGTVLGLSYTEVIPLLVAAIKELKAEFDAYKATHP